MKVAALFVRSDSIYKSIEGVDCYDYDRDAVTYSGMAPVVAHPPCGVWGRFRRHVERASGRRAEQDRKLGLLAVDAVRKWGGVLEQPACSDLWTAASLPLRGFDQWGGYTLQVCQSWWGHEAEKCTWLYVVNGGWPLPSYDFDFSVPRWGLLDLGRREREATPPALARWLVDLAMAAGGHSRARPFDLAEAIAAAGHSNQGPLDQVTMAPAGHSLERPFQLEVT